MVEYIDSIVELEAHPAAPLLLDADAAVFFLHSIVADPFVILGCEAGKMDEQLMVGLVDLTDFPVAPLFDGIQAVDMLADAIPATLIRTLTFYHFDSIIGLIFCF